MVGDLRMYRNGRCFYIHAEGYISPHFCFDPAKKDDVDTAAALFYGLLNEHTKLTKKPSSFLVTKIVTRLKGLIKWNG